MSASLFKGKLIGSFRASQSLLIAANTVTLDWQIVSSGGPTTLQWYMEFSDDNADWHRELAEEDTGSGVVSMTVVVRTFHENGGAALADGTHKLNAQFVRRAQFVRVQMRVTAGAAQVTLTAPFGDVPVS